MRVSELALAIKHGARQDVSAALVLAGEAIHRIVLADGKRVTDASDMRAYLEELAEALNPPILEAEFPSQLPSRDHLRVSAEPKTLRQEQPRNWDEAT